MNQQKTVIRLGGPMIGLFGKYHHRLLETTAPQEAIKALSLTLPGFEQYLNTAKVRGLAFAVFVGKRNIGKDDLSIGAGGSEIRIMPIIIGSKRGGVFQTILGAALIAAAFFAPAAWAAAVPYLYSAGASLALGGVIQLLTPQMPGLGMRQDPDNKPSYAFGGPVNSTAQGNPVGVLYTQDNNREIGGAIISAGIYTEDQQ
ncbi:tail assembly protein [Hafnia alvei]|uniref:tail assembly protein n=1 Tax=Hafnia alvei TaxID=569 RepID=UPI0010352842|nr:tail assembly protein [Hafnia alvei]TBL40759.1 tail assembly protein [Hafnia alvei]